MSGVKTSVFVVFKSDMSVTRKSMETVDLIRYVYFLINCHGGLFSDCISVSTFSTFFFILRTCQKANVFLTCWKMY